MNYRKVVGFPAVVIVFAIGWVLRYVSEFAEYLEHRCDVVCDSINAWIFGD